MAPTLLQLVTVMGTEKASSGQVLTEPTEVTMVGINCSTFNRAEFEVTGEGQVPLTTQRYWLPSISMVMLFTYSLELFTLL